MSVENGSIQPETPIDASGSSGACLALATPFSGLTWCIRARAAHAIRRAISAAKLLDIAGPAWAERDSATRDAGGTGCLVRTLIELAHRYPH